MTVKLITEHDLEFPSLKGGCTGLFELHLSKCHIVVNHMSGLKYGHEDPNISQNLMSWLYRHGYFM